MIPGAQPDSMQHMFDGFAEALHKSTTKTVTVADRERASEATEAARFYSILFASSVDVIQDDGTVVETIIPATINPNF